MRCWNCNCNFINGIFRYIIDLHAINWKKNKLNLSYTEAYDSDCLLPTFKFKHGGGSVMMWAPMSWYSAVPVIINNSRMTANEYSDIFKFLPWYISAKQYHIPGWFPRQHNRHTWTKLNRYEDYWSRGADLHLQHRWSKLMGVLVQEWDNILLTIQTLYEFIQGN